MNTNGWQWVLVPDTAASQAQATADAVAANLANNYSTTTQMNSAINQAAGEITQTVEKTIQTTVLGNLLPHTDDFTGWLLWTNIDGERDIDPSNHEVCIYSDGNGNTSFYVPGFQIKLEPGTTYTLSGQIKKSGDLNYALFQFYNDNYANPYNTVPTVTTDYEPFKWSFSTASSQTDNDFVFEIVHTGSLIDRDYAMLFVKDIKLEKGAVATECTPSWEDKTTSSQIISTINQSPEEITIAASKLNLQGYVTITSLATPGQTIIDGGNIITGTLSADVISGGTINATNINVTNLNASNITRGSMSGGYLGNYSVPDYKFTPAVGTSLGYADFSNAVFSGRSYASYMRAATGEFTSGFTFQYSRIKKQGIMDGNGNYWTVLVVDYS